MYCNQLNMKNNECKILKFFTKKFNQLKQKKNRLKDLVRKTNLQNRNQLSTINNQLKLS